MGAETRLAIGTGAVLLVLVVGSAVARPAAEENPAAAPAPTPEEAVGQFVAANGAAYAGDCSAARSPQDIGAVCSKFVAQRGNVRTYLVGRTFSEFSERVFVEQDAAGWRFVSAAPLDDSAAAGELQAAAA